ncbi:MAG: RNA-directed DNA polymerase [Verrucomicrobia bacterium]|nr:MAG: RNA-directed DNA polymerase [Verrucomicrobiota bacterium]
MISRRLAIRALNEARRTDPLAYLSLRYTAATTVGLKDEWAREVAPKIVMGRDGSTIVESMQFKELNQTGGAEFRTVRYCGGPHQLAEAALIEACANAGGPFIPSDSVYSYRYPSRSSYEGVFIPYFELFAKRQNDIGRRCRQFSKHTVVYLDIKQFYPSVKVTKVRTAWKSACMKSNLDPFWATFGNYLIDLQFTHKDGLLVGPLFSHLLANLYLAEFDREMEKCYPKRYFRYVDDFAFIVKYEDKESLITLVKEKLKLLGLRLNDDKTHWMGAQKWEKNAPFQAPDYADEFLGDESWMYFIDRLKRFLVANPDQAPAIRAAFSNEGIRVPVPKYEAAVREEIYQTALKRRRRHAHFDSATAEITVSDIIVRGRTLRSKYLEEFETLWPDFQEAKGLIRKWKKSRIRYLIGRCLLLATKDQLVPIHSAVCSETELADYAAMLEAIVRGNYDPLLKLGWKPSLALAPALSAEGIVVRSVRKKWTQQALEALVALKLCGCQIDVELPANAQKKNRFKVGTARHKSNDWINEADLFYRELMSLTGGRSLDDFTSIIQTPVDPNEEWASFAEELLGLNPT